MTPVAVAIPFEVPVAFMETFPIYPHNKIHHIWQYLTGSQKVTLPVNRYEGFTANGAVVLRDGRGTSKAEIPDIDLKSESLGSDPGRRS
jgi:hypothetical protein